MTEPTPTQSTAPTDPAPATSQASTEPPRPADDDAPLGPAGIKALQKEREAREALAREFAPLREFVAKLAPKGEAEGKTEVQILAERQAAMEKTIADERAARWRAEVAHEKGLTPQQAARLVGASRDEFVADADSLLSLFPAAAASQPTGPRAPAPDRSQGGNGTGEVSEIDAQIAAAEKAGDTRRVIALKTRKFAETK